MCLFSYCSFFDDFAFLFVLIIFVFRFDYRDDCLYWGEVLKHYLVHRWTYSFEKLIYQWSS